MLGMHSTICHLTILFYLYFVLLQSLKRRHCRETGAVSCLLDMCTALHNHVAFYIPSTISENFKDPPKISHFPFRPLSFLVSFMLSPPDIITSGNYDVKQFLLIVLDKYLRERLVYIDLAMRPVK